MSAAPPAPVTAADWDRVVAAAPVPVVVDFWAPWCVPCRPVTALVGELAAAHGDRIRAVGVDVDAEPALAARHAILSIPTIILFAGGRPVERLDGRIRRGRLDAALAPYLDQE